MKAVITVFGRKAVLEALRDPDVEVALVLVDRDARGDAIDAVVGAAKARGLALKRVAGALSVLFHLLPFAAGLRRFP